MTTAVKADRRKRTQRSHSFPHILSINNAIKKNGTTDVKLFGAGNNLFLENFGNPKGIEIKYISNNPLAPYSYPCLLFSKIFKVGLIRIEAQDEKQAKIPLHLLNNPGAVKFEGATLIMSHGVKNPICRNITIHASKFWITPETEISLKVKNGARIIIYFYPIEEIRICDIRLPGKKKMLLGDYKEAIISKIGRSKPSKAKSGPDLR